MRIVFTGGGTVGHLSPAIAVAEELIKRDRKTEILFIGREGGNENEIIKKAGFNIKTVSICGFERKLSFKNVKNFFKTIKATKEAEAILRDFRPDVVLGTGGYVCYPVLKSAINMKIKTAIHESNAYPGLAARLLAAKCDLILVNLEGTEKNFSKKAKRFVVSGNPVREEFFKASRENARKKLGIKPSEILITSFGGSGGSAKLNDTIADCMINYSTKHERIKHIHACGIKYYQNLKKKFPLLTRGCNGCLIKPYIDDMATMLKASDVAITRCGAMTLAELSATGTPSILIPSPNVTNDHQRLNARLLTERGAAIMIDEAKLTEKELTAELKKLIENAKERQGISDCIKTLSKKDSRQIIASELEKLLQ